MTRSPAIDVPEQEISAFCKKHGIARLSLFGSVLRDDFAPGSDIDVLVEFQPGQTPGLAFFAMQSELSELLGWKVDLKTPQDLSRYFRDRVLEEARIIYDAA